MQGGGEGHESQVAREPRLFTLTVLRTWVMFMRKYVKNCNHKDGGS
jgi:hypothetical protein